MCFQITIMAGQYLLIDFVVVEILETEKKANSPNAALFMSKDLT